MMTRDQVREEINLALDKVATSLRKDYCYNVAFAIKRSIEKRRKPTKREYWLTVYDKQVGGIYRSLEMARSWKRDDCLGIKHVVIDEDELL